MLGDQLNFRKRKVFRNIFKGHILGAFDIRSHQRDNGKEKVKYNTMKSALKAAGSMKKKHGRHFSAYKCIYCDGYHLGANRENKKYENV